MKRRNDLYQNICNFSNIKRVYKIVRTNCRNHHKLYDFEIFENINLYDILLKLYLKDYNYSKYHIFLIYEPKYRLIMSENIADKIVNHLISMYILLPSLEHKLIDTNVATRKNMGSGKALDYLTRYLNHLRLSNKEVYILKIDIKKYFYNIDHEILISKLKKDIKDKDALDIVIKTINSTNEEYVNKKIKEACYKEINRVNKLNISIKEKKKKIDMIKKVPLYKYNKGLGIGNMTSQILAIYYLNDVDHIIKEKYKCKYYIRYMDDLIILDNDKNKLLSILNEVKKEINNLKLEVNDKSKIFKLSHGFNFLGYSFKEEKGKLLIRASNKTKIKINRNLSYLKKKNSLKYERSLISYKGYFMRLSRKKNFTYIFKIWRTMISCNSKS